ncbi:hypothetical protein HHL11_05590 [Ramlibacter sp. G-1-2-2]|uniref:histidine kinase n=1 Tax=Ramlibacter agri TaxID=2728837 RepID=A0A848GXY7_9BURK|nr:MASE1 domain-containing protein [Ramlibacter agri]NML43214.1 hypothetical protein [Ramlibacter agri]
MEHRATAPAHAGQEVVPPSAREGAAPPLPRMGWAIAALAIAYYGGSRLGLALVVGPPHVSLFWPPAALLMGALALVPLRWWWAMLAATAPIHVLAQVEAGVQAAQILSCLLATTTDAVIGASILRWAAPVHELVSVRAVLAFCVAAVAGPFAASMVDMGVMHLLGGPLMPAKVWQLRFFAEMVAILAFTPVILTWSHMRGLRLRPDSGTVLELGALIAGLFAVSVLVFDSLLAGSASPSLLYLPMPFLMWAALRFGPPLTSASYALVAFLAIWGAAHGRGPFLAESYGPEALQVQLFLVMLAVPLLLLSAVIEERRDAERRLQASQELFSVAFREGPGAVAITRGAWEVVEANERWLALLGYPPDALARGGRVASFDTHLEGPNAHALLEMGRAGGPKGQAIEMALRDCLGNLHTVLASASDVQVRGRSCKIWILRDITAQRQAEADAQDQRRQLTHLTRVASLTDFSSTIAHELNQPLTAILSNAQAALRFLAQDPPQVSEIRTILGEIADADKRAGLLIHHLRLLLKKGEEEFVQLDLSRLVEEVLNLVRGEFLVRNVQLRSSFSPDLAQVTGDRVQLQQLVLNLVINACEAMQASGKAERMLTVTTMHGSNRSVDVLVSDTGPGLSSQLMARVFEPFFTTKPNGLGLGLSICRKIATAHGGSLTAESRDGQGTTFRISLPAAAPARMAPRAASAAPAQASAATLN